MLQASNLIVNMKLVMQSITRFMGVGQGKSSHREKLISGLGGFTGIFLVLIMTQQVINVEDASLIVASMGASAVLLFAVPHGPLSQPWALGGGQVISAFIGVSCYLLFPNLHIAAGLAVGLSIIAMYYLRCIHPPGGATALSAVMAGPSVHALGYQYILTPVLINVLIIFAVAMLFNSLFPWRRYPSSLVRQPAVDNKKEEASESLGEKQIDYALQKLNHYVDVSNQDLENIFQLARQTSSSEFNIEDLKLGHYYSNGLSGDGWAIRRLIDESDSLPTNDSLIIYKVVAGKGRQENGTMKRQEFARWVKYEVHLKNNTWERVPFSSQQTSNVHSNQDARS